MDVEEFHDNDYYSDTMSAKYMCIFGLNDNEIVRITPTDNTIVEIYDNDTVDEEKTIFV